MKAIFMGSPAFAVPSLLAVAEVCDLRMVITQPDRPAGRGRRSQSPEAKLEAQRQGIAVMQPETIRDEAFAHALRGLDLDVAVVVAYGRILPRGVLEIPRHGCINVHASLLPAWRGAAPIQRAILAGDRKSGVSIMQLDEGCDTGPVYELCATEIFEHETSGQLADRLARLGGERLRVVLHELEAGVASPAPQDHARATMAPKLSKAEGRVDWSRSAEVLHNHVRGMDPWPGAWCDSDAASLKLFDSRGVIGVSGTPGTILAIDNDGVTVGCGRDALKVGAFQAAGARRTRACDYLRGQNKQIGDLLVTPRPQEPQ